MSGDPLADLLEREDRERAVKRLLEFSAATAIGLLSGKMPDGSEVARELVDVALSFVPEEELRNHLTPGAAMRVERLADAASRIARRVR